MKWEKTMESIPMEGEEKMVESMKGTKGKDNIERLRSLAKSVWKRVQAIKCSSKKCFRIFVLIILLVIAVYMYRVKVQFSGNQKFSISDAMQFSLGIRNDYLLQDCHRGGLKRTFPDLEYVLLGYNILKGYPLANGHDPGLTKPIFKADYKKQLQTADCKFSIPDGYNVIPDVSCEVSFSSSVIRSMKDLEKSMSASAKVSGGAYGASFSASAEYKKNSRTIESSDKLMIITTATCQYYFADMDDLNPPPFSDSFLQWLEKLQISTNDDDFLDFVEYYGTHYLKSATFGARFMKEHTVDKSSFKNLEGSSISVEAQASYSGAFSVGGGFGFSQAQKNAVENFNSKVETKTTTVGSAPPSNGDATTWASTVKQTPVPFSYKMGNIDDLFSHNFMKRYPNIDGKKLKKKIADLRQDKRLLKKIYQRMEDVSVSCRVYNRHFEMNEFCLKKFDKSLGVGNKDRCHRECFEDVDCLGYSLLVNTVEAIKLKDNLPTDMSCRSYKADENHEMKLTDKCSSMFAAHEVGRFFTVFPQKMKVNSQSYATGEVAGKLFFKHLRVTPPSHAKGHCGKGYSYSDKCVDSCIADVSCTIAYQIAKEGDIYCCYLDNSIKFNKDSAVISNNVNEYLAFVKTKCQ